MARSPNNPTKGPPGSTKGKHHKTATTNPPQRRATATTSRRGYLASIFGTLLSSQGSSAHRLRPSGHQSGLCSCCVSILPHPRRGPESVQVGDLGISGVFPAVGAEDLL